MGTLYCELVREVRSVPKTRRFSSDASCTRVTMYLNEIDGKILCPNIQVILSYLVLDEINWCE